MSQPKAKKREICEIRGKFYVALPGGKLVGPFRFRESASAHINHMEGLELIRKVEEMRRTGNWQAI